ncbi:MAG: pilus assembly protein [Deltaproteobacteria bacterium]|nr:pilus assembly protein [Deltaproteobacteria bacterium]
MSFKRKRNILFCQWGNGLLETVLFTPLALFFLLVVTDAGLYLVRKSVFTNAVRAGLASRAHHANSSPLYLDSNFALRVDEGVLEEILDGVVKETSDAVTKGMSSASFDDYKLRAVGVVFEVDEHSGKLLRYSFNGSAESHGNFSLKTRAPRYPYKTQETFLREQLDHANSLSPSSYSVPTGPIVDPQTGYASNRYYGISLGIYVELTALTGGYAPSAVKNSLGEYFAIQQQELELLHMRR